MSKAGSLVDVELGYTKQQPLKKGAERRGKPIIHEQTTLHKYCTEFGYRYNTPQQSNVERFEDALKKVTV